jgi:hypothetical protein
MQRLSSPEKDGHGRGSNALYHAYLVARSRKTWQLSSHKKQFAILYQLPYVTISGGGFNARTCRGVINVFASR